MKLVLGSASSRRKQILQNMGYEFAVVKPNIDEKAIRDDDPERLTLALAHAKAHAVADKLEGDALVIASDQVTYFEKQILEKPESQNEAREMLKSYSGKRTSTVTAVVVLNTKNGVSWEGIDIANVDWSMMEDSLIDSIVQNPEIDVLDHGGAYAVEHPLFAGYASVKGEIESVMGLPKKLTQKLLKQAGL